MKQGYSTNVEYYVLKQGRQEGPFTGADLLDQLSAGRFNAEDLGQPDGARHWMPLRKLISAQGATPPSLPLLSRDNREDEAGEFAEAADDDYSEPTIPDNFERDGKQFWSDVVSGVRGLFRHYPLECGVVCFIAACSLLLLSYVQILLVGPVLIAALIGGGSAMLRGKVVAGLALCAAAVFIPALIWAVFFWAAQLFR